MSTDHDDTGRDPWARQPQPGDGLPPEVASILGDWAREQNARPELGQRIADELARRGEGSPDRASWSRRELAARIRDAGRAAELEAGS